MASTYTVNRSDGSVLTTLHSLEYDGPGNLSVPRTIQETRPQYTVLLVTSNGVSLGGTFKVSSNVVDRFPAGATFSIVSSTNNNGTYTVGLAGAFLSGPDTVIPVDAPFNVNAPGTPLLGSARLNAFVLTENLLYRFIPGFTFKVSGPTIANIVSANSVTDVFVVPSNFSPTGPNPTFTVGFIFDVVNSGANDGTYTVIAPGSSYSVSLDQTTIPVLAVPLTTGAVGQITQQNLNVGSWTVTAFGSYVINALTSPRTLIPVVAPITSVALPFGQIYYSILASTSLMLPGKGTINFGEFLIEDIIRHLENFANPTPPIGPPSVGQLWYDTATGPASDLFAHWDGTMWSYDVFVGSGTITLLDPENPNQIPPAKMEISGGGGAPADDVGLRIRPTNLTPAGDSVLRVTDNVSTVGVGLELLRVEFGGYVRTSNNLEVRGTGDSFVYGRLGIGANGLPVMDRTLTVEGNGISINSDTLLDAVLEINPTTLTNSSIIDFQIAGVPEGTIRIVGSTAGHPLEINSTTARNVTMVQGGGSVVIGAAVPTTRLHVAGNISADIGSALVPSFTFNGDLDTGMYQGVGVPNTLSFALAGSQKVRIDATGITVFSGVFTPGAATPLTPEYTFTNNPDTGLFRSALNTLAIASGGIQRAFFSDTAFSINPGAITATVSSIIKAASFSGVGTGGVLFVEGGNGGTTSGNGGQVLVRGGIATTGAGGLASLFGGAAGGINMLGGQAQVEGGASTGTAAGGAAFVTGGDGGATGGEGGSAIIRGGIALDGNGGSVFLLGAAGVGTSRTGGSVTLTAGNSTTAVAGGAITLTAGIGGVTGVGGTVTITGGPGGTASGAGGAVTVRGGTAIDGNGGSVDIIGRSGVGPTNRSGGNVTLTAGDFTGTGTPGAIVFLSVNATTPVEVRFREGSGSGVNYVGFKAPTTLAGNTVWTLPAVDGSAGTALISNGAGILSFSGGGGIAAPGSDTQVIFNDGGFFGADAGFTYNKTTDTVSISGAIRNANGTALLPSYSFTSDLTKGMYSSGAGEISFAIGGLQKVRIDASGITTFSGFFATGTGGAGAPEFSFANDPDTGLFSSTPNVLGISAGGVSIATFSATGVSAGAFTLPPGGKFIAPAGGVPGAPNFTFTTDLDTGIFNFAPDAVAISGGGIIAALFSPGGIFAGPTGSAAAPSHAFMGDTNTGLYNGPADNLFVSTGGIQRFVWDSLGNAVTGTGALATSATAGFLYIPTMPGVPVGTPTTYTGRAALALDTTGNKLYGFDPVSLVWLDLTAGAGTTPGGADTQVQFNDSSTFNGDDALTWNKTTHILNVGTTATPGIITGKDATAAVGSTLIVEAGNGDGAGNAGGALTLQGGSATDGNGGAVTVTGRAAVGTNMTGGTLTLTGGASTGLDTGGEIVMTGGAGGAGGTGGTITITGGPGGSTDGPGGQVTVRGGTSTDGDGGSVFITGRSATGAVWSGGSVTITTGEGSGTGLAGRVFFLMGNGGFKFNTSGNFATAGDAKSNEYILRTETSTAALTEMFLDGTGGTARMLIASDSTVAFEIHIVARRTDANNESAEYQRKGAIDNNAGTTALVAAVQTLGTDIEDSAAWDVSVTADDTNDSLRIQVTGEAGKTIRWVAFVRTIEVAG